MNIYKIKRSLGGKFSLIEEIKGFINRITPYKYYEIKYFFKNLPKFIRFAWNYRSWDMSFAVEIFAENIEDVGKSIRDGWYTDRLKEYRRCMYAAHMLRKNFIDMHTNIDKSEWNNAKNKSITFRALEGGGRCLEFKYKYGEEYAKKIEAATDKRLENWKAKRRMDTLEYINKYYDKWWD